VNRRGLEFLGTLAGGLVHEIKNPLSTLRINLTLLQEDLHALLPEERKVSRRIEVLQHEVQRLDEVLADFMRYAGMRRLERAPHDLAGIVDELVEFLGPGFDVDGIGLAANLPVLEADVDASLFKQALLNLLLNAQAATPRGGRVVVEGERVGKRIEISVVDDGAGIDARELDLVLEVYYSGSRTGSGLGLPTARRIMEEHGGGLELESEPGRGTSVLLWLPAGGAS